MFIELQNKSTLLKIEKINKINLLREEIEFVYENENNNVYTIQRYKTEQRAKEVYQNLKKFINWKPYVKFGKLPENCDTRDIVDEIRERSNIDLSFGITEQIEIQLNNNAIFEMPEE